MALTAGIPRLRTFYVYLTSGCNCACRHCWIVPASAGTGSLLAPEILRRAIVQALPLGLATLKWTGGEPTLHPAFDELLAVQKEFGLDGRLETNGLLVDERLAAKLVDAGVSSVSVSLDGARARTHEAIRGVPGGFARSCDAIRALAAAGYGPELILTLQRSNLGEVEETVALAAALGAGSVKINVLQPLLRGAELASAGEAPGPADVLELAGRLEARRDSFPVAVTLDVPLAFRPLGALVDGSAGGVCDIARILGILSTGEYALCGIGSHVPELVLGRVDEVDLSRVWGDHPLLTGLREGLPRHLQGICAECLMKAACRGSCVAANYKTSGDLFAAYWFCREAAAQGLFPASRRMACLPAESRLE